MSVIRKLSGEVIGQIAAGEVVERPASAVKELVENSIDAGAKNITVELRDGGIRYLRVTDNGAGIPADQLRMAFERHATSKIYEPKDLYDIHTLGFRGEALASIAAVSKVTLTTRTQTADFGARAVVEAGEFTDIRQAASPVGTNVVVEDLFFNTPVRLKFLKKPSVEASMVSDYMLRLILSRPDISFRFVNQGKTIYHSTGDGSVESALFCLYGRDALRQMRKVSGTMNGVVISGYVGAGELARGNRQQQSFFVNGRYFKSQLLSRALESGCEGHVMIGKFPMCALFLEVPYQNVDVNVHPNKLEVRFQDENAVAQAVQTLVREGFSGMSLSERLTHTAAPEIPAVMADRIKPRDAMSEVTLLNNPLDEGVGKLGVEAEHTPPTETTAPEPAQEVPAQTPSSMSEAERQEAIAALEPIVIKVASKQEHASLGENTAPSRVAQVMRQAARFQPSFIEPVVQPPVTPPAESNSSVEETPEPQPSQPTEEAEQTAFEEVAQAQAPLRLVGIVFDTYWIFETGDRLLLVDQHAAHERILYDQMMERFQGTAISQQLLSPQLVRLTAHEMALASEFIPALNEAGFHIEPFDESSISVRAIPTLFGQNEPPRELLLEALDEWQSGRGQVTRERVRKRVAQMACKRAIKGGDKLNEQQVQGFLQTMLRSDVTPTCPHGRPIVTEITRYALEKRFKRIQ